MVVFDANAQNIDDNSLKRGVWMADNQGNLQLLYLSGVAINIDNEMVTLHQLEDIHSSNRIASNHF